MLYHSFKDDTSSIANTTEPEVKAIMQWIKSEPFVLSVSLDGGGLLATYPLYAIKSGGHLSTEFQK